METTRTHFSKPFQFDGSPILERDPQLNGHVPDRLGNKNLAGPRKGAEPGGEVHRAQVTASGTDWKPAMMPSPVCLTSRPPQGIARQDITDMQQMQGPGVVQRRRHQRRILDVGEHDHPEGRVDSVLQVQRVVGIGSVLRSPLPSLVRVKRIA
jgi:hypothetical protein